MYPIMLDKGVVKELAFWTRVSTNSCHNRIPVFGGQQGPMVAKTTCKTAIKPALHNHTGCLTRGVLDFAELACSKALRQLYNAIR
jgi:hypothetical protein